MGEYNITPQYYQSQTSKIPFYYITRYDNIDMMGIYARGLPNQTVKLGDGITQYILPLTTKMSIDTSPSWATMQSNGQVKINRAGYYDVTLNYRGIGEMIGYYFTVAIRAQQKGVKMNLSEQTTESFRDQAPEDYNPWQTVSVTWYFDVGDLVWGTTEISDSGGTYIAQPTSLIITPYQFYSKFWG